MVSEVFPRANGDVALREAARRRDLIRRAEAFMWQHAEEPIDLATIADGVGCSVRKLLYSFKRTYGVGALSHFKTLRLTAVRAALMSGDAQRTISDIAADYGFWHMGHFGADYKALFGVTPSQTRRAANATAAQGRSSGRSRVHRRTKRRSGNIPVVAVLPRNLLHTTANLAFASP